MNPEDEKKAANSRQPETTNAKAIETDCQAKQAQVSATPEEQKITAAEAKEEKIPEKQSAKTAAAGGQGGLVPNPANSTKTKKAQAGFAISAVAPKVQEPVQEKQATAAAEGQEECAQEKQIAATALSEAKGEAALGKQTSAATASGNKEDSTQEEQPAAATASGNKEDSTQEEQPAATAAAEDKEEPASKPDTWWNKLNDVWQNLSIRKKLWLYFAGFAILILILLWSMQVASLPTLYESGRRMEAQRAANFVTNHYQDKQMSDLDFALQLEREAYNRDVGLLLLDFENNIYYLVDSTGGGGVLDISKNPATSSRIWFSTPNPEDGNTFTFRKSGAETGQIDDQFGFASPLLPALRQLMNGADEVSYTVNNPRLGLKNLLLAKQIGQNGQNIFAFVTAGLDPIDATVNVLKRQLGGITILLLLLASIMATIFSNHIARPILRLKKSAQELSGGNLDVTFQEGGYEEINQLANTLNYAVGEISKTDHLRKDLIANLSHDLRTPLTMITAYGEMIRDLSGDNPEKRQEHLQVIIDESNRLSALVTDILASSKLEAGVVKLKKESFDLSQVLKNALAVYHILEEQQGYHIAAEIEENIWVYADLGQMEQVIFNLLNNAINHTGEDKTIYVRLQKENDSAKLSIRDTGKGIAPEEIDAIWERYYKGKTKSKRDKLGSGLGLSIVKSVLQLHQAQFGVESKLGEGSTFWFTLPLDFTNLS